MELRAVQVAEQCQALTSSTVVNSMKAYRVS